MTGRVGIRMQLLDADPIGIQDIRTSDGAYGLDTDAEESQGVRMDKRQHSEGCTSVYSLPPAWGTMRVW